MPAVFVDTSTITVTTPNRNAKNQTAHISVSNDGSTFTSLPSVRNGGAGTFLDYQFVGHAPWGSWDLGTAKSVTSTAGVTSVSVSRKGGQIVDGKTLGSDFYASDDLFCAHGVSTKRSFDFFTEVEYVTGELIDTEADTDQLVTVSPTVGDSFNTYVTRDTTYEVATVDDSGDKKWKWRKWSRGYYPSGTYSELNAFTTLPVELEYGVFVTFVSTSGKSADDLWRFDAVTKSPYTERGTFIDSIRVRCPLPPADPSGVDVDLNSQGSQRELKVSYRGEYSYSDVTYTDNTGVKTVTGDPKSLGVVTQDLAFTDDLKLHVDGYFSGPEDLTFEIEMTSATAFKWRAYRVNDALCKTETSGAWCGYSTGETVSENHPVHLRHGVYVSFTTLTGKVSGDNWKFDAFTFWSTTFSPVDVEVSSSTADDDAIMYVEGTYIGTSDHTYEVEIMADTGAFRWRSFDATSDGTGITWTDDVSVSQSLTALDKGVSVNWLTLAGKTFQDTWSFTAFTGHVITTLGKSYVSDAIPRSDNTVGDARVPTITGSYLGSEKARITIEIGGTCTTSCSEFKWKYDKADLPLNPFVDTIYTGGVFSELTTMQILEQQLSYGINVTWGLTSGYKVGNEYFIYLNPMATSVLPATPGDPDPNFSAIDLRSTYNDEGNVPAKDAVITVEFTSGTQAKWRLNTEPFSPAETIATDEPFTLTHGVKVSFAQASGFTPGSKYLIPLKTHIAHIHNITTQHGGTKNWPSISQPVAAAANYANFPNQGSPLSDVTPLKTNTGAHTIHAFPAAGSLQGGGSAVPGEGYANQGGVGLSNIINGVPTQGYLQHTYPTAYLKIVGAAEVTGVTGVLADELTVAGTYTGKSSFVYQLEPETSSTFKWRKYAYGASEAEATAWTGSKAVSTTVATAIDSGLTALFGSATYTVSSANRWTFTAHKGHTFQFRDSGRANWSQEKVIDGTTQPLSCGIAVRFTQLSGYAPGDQFIVTNRTVDSFGTFTGLHDSTYTVDVLDRAEYDPPVFHRGSGSTTTGLQQKLTVTGTYTGRSTYVYEVKITSITHTSLISQFQWRKYLRGYGAGGGPFSGTDLPVSLSPILLDDGTYIQWAAISGHAVDDAWRVVAHAGDVFKWRASIDDDAWSLPQSVTDVGLVESDADNAGSQVANTDVRATGEYAGITDVSFVIEVLAGGSTFRWKKGQYLPRAGIIDDSTGTIGSPYCCGTENVLFDSTHDNANGVGTWSPATNMASDTTSLSDNVYVSFITSSGYTAGDLFYIPAKKTRHHKLSHGVSLAFGGDSGYSPDDRWTLSATSGIAARGPSSGGTEIDVKGYGFLDSSGLSCRLTDGRTTHTSVVPATFVSSEHVICTSPEHPLDTISDPVFVGSGSSALVTRGIFTGTQSLKFTVQMISSTTFKWRADPVDEVTGAWSATVTTTPGESQLLEQGVSVHFDDGETYGANDEWVFTAYSSEFVSSEQFDIQLGTLRPGVTKQVSVSNDGGVSWSADDNGLTQFLFSDVYVSPSGDDQRGDGTKAAPYRTIQRGIHASLSPSQYGYAVSNATNLDSIIVSPGRYTGAGNTGLFSLGKNVEVVAAKFGTTVIDCSVRVSGAVHFGETMQSGEGAGKVSLTGVNVENCGM